MNRVRIFALMLLGCLASGMGLAQSAETISFNRDIRPILSDKCFACHGPDQNHREGDLRLDERDAATRSAILPGNSKDSELVARILSKAEDEVMPPPHTQKSLSADEIRKLREWIDAGAPYEAHWSLVPVPRSVTVPKPQSDTAWVRNPIDSFVLAELSKRNLQHAEPASRETWLRRVSFDLTGLPPTLEEIDNFLADQSEKAFERVVDRLLNSTAYGERMAADWLDAARYADTFGYQADRDMHVWPWREWVIRAFNDNLPYNQFIVWQLAGDMLDNPTRDQRLATAFNRLHRQTNEGGSIEQEFRTEYVADRVRTMGTAMLGLTLECARCHDHKYDPITQREYYSLQAIFNNIDEHGLYSHFTETAPTPAMLLYEGDQESSHRRALQALREKESALSAAKLRAKQRMASQAGTNVEVTIPKPTFSTSFEEIKDSGDYKIVPGKDGNAVQFGGDDQLTLKEAPELQRSKPFTLSLWLRAQEHSPRMIVAHQSRAAEDSAFRGFSLVLDQGVPVVSLIHFWPGNAISVRGKQPLATGKWTHVCITYDGSSHAEGLRVYIDGVPIELETVRDRLTRDFIHRSEWGDSEAKKIHLSLGARFRDVGFKNGTIDSLAVYEDELTPAEVFRLAENLSEIPVPSLVDHLVSRQDAECAELRESVQKLRTEENDLVSQVRQVMVMEEMTGRRPTFVLSRGAYDAPGVQVSPTVPAALAAGRKQMPSNRLEFARWLVESDHPLTSRVAVNRFWRLFFGQGLVATVEDFGNQGDSPSHPELLDWLARHFIDSGWNVRDLCKLIVLSSTYRQSSTPAHPNYYAQDPTNRYLSRGPRHRLGAEQLRDNALAASGLLVPKLGGPSVFPYQPEGLWEESGTGKSYRQSKGSDLYRRSLYSFWRRTSPPPSMTTFDAPSREFCMVRRERTATPMQALTLLNDPQFIEAARAIAERCCSAHPNDPREALTMAFRILTSRRPHPNELEVVEQLRLEQRKVFASNAEATKQFLAIGESPRNESLDATDVAAMTSAVQLLMSFDECVTKR